MIPKLKWSISLTLRQTDNAAPPTTYPSLSDFIDAVTDAGAPDRHARVELPSLADFVALFSPAGTSVPLGDWDEDGILDTYLPGILSFAHPILLQDNNQVFQVSYQDTAFDTPAVVYLRAQVRG